MAYDHPGWPPHFDYEDPDPPVDEGTTLRCPNPECDLYYDPEDEGPRGETWHPEIFFEYQGVVPHGGIVSFHEDDAFDCDECGTEGVEV
jgi:hypothetical protein